MTIRCRDWAAVASYYDGGWDSPADIRSP